MAKNLGQIPRVIIRQKEVIITIKSRLEHQINKVKVIEQMSQPLWKGNKFNTKIVINKKSPTAFDNGKF